jgi:glycosyltransferase involved in cell wall biosynthesis
MNKVILFADARHRITLNQKSTISRHVEYIRELQRFEGYDDAKLLVLQPTKSLFKFKEDDVELIKIVRLSIFQLLNLKKFLSVKEIQVSLIVSGDPWESYLFSSFVKFIIGKTIPVQVQIHSELSKEWNAQRVSNRFRTKIAGFALRKASNVRAVSNEQRNFIVDKYKLEEKKVVAIPVQLNYADAPLQVNTRTRPLTIGFIGRVHKERNIKRFVEIAGHLMSKDKEIKVVIATTGNMNSSEGKLFSRIPADRLSKFENLTPEKLPIYWENVGVLLSTSSSESFGRSIREAIVNGIPVLAHTSMGSRELKSECEESVRLFDDKDSLDSLFEMFQSLYEKNVPSEYTEIIKIKNKRIPSEIAESWQKTANMFHIR